MFHHIILEDKMVVTFNQVFHNDIFCKVYVFTNLFTLKVYLHLFQNINFHNPSRPEEHFFNFHLPTCHPMPAKHGNLSKDGTPNTVYMKSCVLLLTLILRRNMSLKNVLLIDNFTKHYQTPVLTIVNQKINQFRCDRQ